MDVFITAIVTFFGYLAANQWLLPWVEKLISNLANRKNKKDLETLNVESELLEIEKNNNQVYENQINFFVGQVENLQKQLLRKSDEINEMAVQCDELRTELLSIKKQLFEQKKINEELTEHVCFNKVCQHRIKTK